ncbi:hypothetical protein ADUPG1_004546, partial [Aduncisulcus paluster]
GKPLTLSDEPETRKPSNQEETRKKYGRAPKGIRWQDWKEHVDELCKELEEKPESEDPLDDPKPESEDSISDMKPERIENEKESDGKPLLAEPNTHTYAENSSTHHSTPGGGDNNEKDE